LSLVYAGDFKWDLDGAGNWKTLSTYPNGSPTPTSEARSANAFNQYTKIGTPLPTTPNLTYDPNGNLANDSHISTTNRHYKWDAFNRLSETELTNTGSGTVFSLYLYDATGRRGFRRVRNASEDLGTLYTYDGWRVLEERELNSSNWNGYRFLKRQFVYGNYLDEPLAMDVDGGGDGACVGGTGDKRYLYLQNTLFSVTGLVDAANGALVEAYAYDPYGRHWRITNAGNPITSFSASTLTFTLGAESTLGNPYLFTGQRFDPETGLHYYKMRYYDSGLGRFVSRDPIGYGDGKNLYQYVGSHPTVRVDTTGMWGANVHSGKTREWAVKALLKKSAAAVIAEADQKTDRFFSGTGVAPEWGDLGRHMDTGGGSQLRAWDNERKIASDYIQLADLSAHKKMAKKYCKIAAEAFGRGLHSLQDSSSHRPYFDGSSWPSTRVHPLWWDYYGTFPADLSHLGDWEWDDNDWWEQHGNSTQSHFGGIYDTWRNSELQILAQRNAMLQVEGDTLGASLGLVREALGSCQCKAYFLKGN
jgi:RHS repeat-associated protein